MNTHLVYFPGYYHYRNISNPDDRIVDKQFGGLGGYGYPYGYGGYGYPYYRGYGFPYGYRGYYY